MAEVIELKQTTTMDISSDKILEKAIGKLDVAFLLGIDKNGDVYIASSSSNAGNLLWLLETAKIAIMRGTEQIEEG